MHNREVYCALFPADRSGHREGGWHRHVTSPSIHTATMPQGPRQTSRVRAWCEKVHASGIVTSDQDCARLAESPASRRETIATARVTPPNGPSHGQLTRKGAAPGQLHLGHPSELSDLG